METNKNISLTENVYKALSIFTVLNSISFLIAFCLKGTIGYLGMDANSTGIISLLLTIAFISMAYLPIKTDIRWKALIFINFIMAVLSAKINQIDFLATFMPAATTAALCCSIYYYIKQNQKQANYYLIYTTALILVIAFNCYMKQEAETVVTLGTYIGYTAATISLFAVTQYFTVCKAKKTEGTDPYSLAIKILVYQLFFVLAIGLLFGLLVALYTGINIAMSGNAATIAA